MTVRSDSQPTREEPEVRVRAGQRERGALPVEVLAQLWEAVTWPTGCQRIPENLFIAAQPLKRSGRGVVDLLVEQRVVAAGGAWRRPRRDGRPGCPRPTTLGHDSVGDSLGRSGPGGDAAHMDQQGLGERRTPLVKGHGAKEPRVFLP